MAKTAFRVIPLKDATYGVEIVTPQGVRSVVSGFTSEGEASDWMVREQRRTLGEITKTVLEKRRPRKMDA